MIILLGLPKERSVQGLFIKGINWVNSKEELDYSLKKQFFDCEYEEINKLSNNLGTIFYPELELISS